MSIPLVLVLCAASGAFYVAASVVMKLAGGAPFLLILLPVYAALGIAAWFESAALADHRFGIVALMILATEVLVTTGVAIGLGERYSLREVAGLLLIVAGMAVVHGDAGAGISAASPAPESSGEIEPVMGALLLVRGPGGDVGRPDGPVQRERLGRRLGSARPGTAPGASSTSRASRTSPWR